MFWKTIKFSKLKEGDCFKSKKYPGEVFVLWPCGAKSVLIAYSKVGGTRYFKPDDKVKKISVKKYNTFEPDDPVWQAMNKGTATRVA